MMKNLILMIAGSILTTAVVFRVDAFRDLALGAQRSSILKVSK